MQAVATALVLTMRQCCLQAVGDVGLLCEDVGRLFLLDMLLGELGAPMLAEHLRNSKHLRCPVCRGY